MQNSYLPTNLTKNSCNHNFGFLTIRKLFVNCKQGTSSVAGEKGRQVKWLTASMFQHSKAIATLPEGFAPPMYKRKPNAQIRD